MSSSNFVRSARRVLSIATPRVAVSTSRTAVARMKFSSESTVNDNDPEVLEKEKEKNLSGEQNESDIWEEEAPGWNEYLATASEAAVKAEHVTIEGGPEMLQRKTIEHFRAKQNPDDVTAGTIEAEYERDEVEGPLKDAMGSVKETAEDVFEEVRKRKI